MPTKALKKRSKKPRLATPERVVVNTMIRGKDCDQYADNSVDVRVRFPGGDKALIRFVVDDKGPCIEVRGLTPDNTNAGYLIIEPVVANLVKVRFT